MKTYFSSRKPPALYRFLLHPITLVALVYCSYLLLSTGTPAATPPAQHAPAFLASLF